MTNKSAMLVYINGYAQRYLKKRAMKNHLSEVLNTQTWHSFDLNPELLPEDVKMHMTEDFFHGACAVEYLKIKKRGGVFINPFILGITINPTVWSNVAINMSDFYHNIMFVEIPYSIYAEVAPKNELITEEQYNVANEKMAELVESLNGQVPNSVTVH